MALTPVRRSALTTTPYTVEDAFEVITAVLNACYLPDGPLGERAKFLSRVIEITKQHGHQGIAMEVDDVRSDHLRNAAIPDTIKAIEAARALPDDVVDRATTKLNRIERGARDIRSRYGQRQLYRLAKRWSEAEERIRTAWASNRRPALEDQQIHLAFLSHLRPTDWLANFMDLLTTVLQVEMRPLTSAFHSMLDGVTKPGSRVHMAGMWVWLHERESRGVRDFIMTLPPRPTAPETDVEARAQRLLEIIRGGASSKRKTTKASRKVSSRGNKSRPSGRAKRSKNAQP